MNQQPDDARLLMLAEAVADGFGVDWADAEASAGTTAERDVIQQLHVLANLVNAGQAADAVHPEDSATRMLWGSLELREEVGRGTFGTVFRAWDLKLDREVALKLLNGDASNRQQVASAVIDEGRLLARVRHPNVVSIYGADRIDGRVGLWMEFIQGRTLKELLRERGPFGAREATLIGIDLCRALAAVHNAGLVHRDVKAQNVMREEGGRIVLMDFGAGGEAVRADDRAPAPMIGTPLYTAPEILQGAEASARSDLYSLGVLLFYLVTGNFPISGGSVEDLRLAHERKHARQLRDLRPDLPANFVRVVEQATAWSPDERFDSAGAMERALDRALGAEPESVSRPSGGVQWWNRKVLIGAAAACALTLAVVAGWNRSAKPRAPSQIRSIAVLPIANVSQDRTDDYLVDGLTDALNAKLGTIAALNVISCTSCPRIRNAREDRPQTGKLLHVDAVVEASLLLAPPDASGAGDRDVQITVTLIQAATDAQLWTKTFTGALTDILSLQKAIAIAVADEINITVTAQEQARLNAAAKHVDPEAYRLYLMGRSLFGKRTVEDMQESLKYYERAIKIDPSFAQPYAGMADVYILLAGGQGSLSSDQGYAAAMAAAQKALALDSGLADAYASMAFAKFFLKWDFEGAGRDFRKAIELNPSYATAHHWYGDYLSAMSKPVEAVAEMKRAVELDPLSDIYSRDVAWPYFFNRQYDEAITELQQTLRRNPRFLPARKLLARSYAQRGMYEEAISESRQVIRERGSGRDKAELACILAQAGQRAEAESILSAVSKRLSSEYVAPYDFALAYAALGKPEDALAWLERAYRERDATMVNLQHDPRFDVLRNDRRFKDLLERMHF